MSQSATLVVPTTRRQQLLTLTQLAKYPATAGRQVTPFAVETYGRLGPQAEAFIETIAAAARKQAMRAGREPGRAQARWRAALDAALLRGIAAQLAAASDGLPGKQVRSRRPVDRTAIEVGSVPLV